MTGRLLLLSTCGTSVLTNRATQETRDWLGEITNERALNDEGKRRLAAHSAERKDSILHADPEARRQMSAELNGIAAVLERWPSSRVQHLLLHTDTEAGRAAAKIIERCLLDDDHHVQLLTSAGLRTDDAMSFHGALIDITCQIEKWFAPPREKGSTALFNLTGGFKAINAFVQAIGMLYADRCVFLFQGARSLMEIPRLPVKLADREEVGKHLILFRRLAVGYSIEEASVKGVPEALLTVIDGEVATSIWGDAVWSRVRKDLLGEKLLKPLSPRLVVKAAVQKAFDGLETDKRIQVNEALDALSAHLDHKGPLPKSQSLKKLKGNSVPPATHELYLWSDGAAWRLFGHFEGEEFIADSIGPHL